MNLTRRKAAALGASATAAVALAASGAAIVSAGTTPEHAYVPLVKQAPVTTSGVKLLSSGAVVDLPSPAKAALGAAASDYGLDVAQAHAVRLGSTPAYVTPGSRGLCLTVSAHLACAPTSEVARGFAFQVSMPPSREDQQKAAAAGVSEAVDRSGTVRGVAPDGVSSVVAIGRDGSTVASTSVSDNVYELDIPDFSEAADLGLVAPGGAVRTLGIDLQP